MKVVPLKSALFGSALMFGAGMQAVLFFEKVWPAERRASDFLSHLAVAVALMASFYSFLFRRAVELPAEWSGGDRRRE